MKAKDILKTHFYIFMRNGSIHEIVRDSLDIQNFMENLHDKGLLVLKEENIVINSVDIIQVVGVLDYLKWVNQKRPKYYILNGKMKQLGNSEDLFYKSDWDKNGNGIGRKFLNIKQQELLETNNKNLIE